MPGMSGAGPDATLPEAVRARLRELPAVDRLAAAVRAAEAGAVAEREAVAVARATLADRRDEVLGGARDAPDLLARARARLRPSLRRVLNATGVVVHTGLGRAPLAAAAREAVARAAEGYANLELDLDGRRARLAPRPRRGAAARAHRRGGRARGQQLRGGDAPGRRGARGRARPRRLARPARRDRRRLPRPRGRRPGRRAPGRGRHHEPHAPGRLRAGGAHRRGRPRRDPARPPVELPHRRLRRGGRGRGALLARRARHRRRGLGRPGDDGLDALAGEPPVRRSVRAGAALVAFSGDKLLGGPQAGLLVGHARGRRGLPRGTRWPARVRIDKLSLAALEATLRLHRDPALARRELPVLAMLTADDATLRARAQRLADATGGTVVEAVARVGGGALPLLELPGPAVALEGGDPGALAAALRRGDPPVVARIADGRVVLDPRTLTDAEVGLAAAAVRAARGA